MSQGDMFALNDLFCTRFQFWKLLKKMEKWDETWDEKRFSHTPNTSQPLDETLRRQRCTAPPPRSTAPLPPASLKLRPWCRTAPPPRRQRPPPWRRRRQSLASTSGRVQRRRLRRQWRWEVGLLFCCWHFWKVLNCKFVYVCLIDVVCVVCSMKDFSWSCGWRWWGWGWQEV